MVTTDEIGEIKIFAALGPAERKRLSRTAADISLVPGEYAVHEGGERALFAVVEGRIEPVKLVDGIERVGALSRKRLYSGRPFRGWCRLRRSRRMAWGRRCGRRGIAGSRR